MKIFLAGTIDDGHSTDWQREVVEELKDTDVEIFNPRRYDFPEYPKPEDVIRQIQWEQKHLDEADHIIMVFKDDSKSPITLLELGLYANSGKLTVYCTDKFYRYWNVQETCKKYNIPLVNNTSTKRIVSDIRVMNNISNVLNK